MNKAVIRILMALCFCLLSVTPIFAQNCDDLVVDEAGALGDGIQSVVTSAQKLANLGAEVRVRIVSRISPHPDINRYEAAIEKSCQSWQSLDGGTRNNLIVLIIAIDDRESGLWYGTEWAKKLDPNWNSIRADVMNPKFRDGEFAKGISAGLDEIASILSATQSSQPAGGARTTSDSGSVFVWILITLAGVALVIFIPVQISKRRKEKEQRRAVQQQAKLARTACSSLVQELEEPMQMLEIKLNDLKTKASDEDTKPLTDRHDTLASRIKNGTLQFGNLSHTANDPTQDNLSAPEYEAMRKSYQSVVDSLTVAKREIGGIESDIKSLLRQLEEAPALVASCYSAIADAQKAITEIENAGYVVTSAEAKLAEAEPELANAKSALAEKRFSEAIRIAKRVLEIAQEAGGIARKRPVLKAELEETIPALKKRITEVNVKIDDGHRLFEDIASSYAESCWQTIAGNGSEAENRIDWATKAQEDAAVASGMAVQKFDEAVGLIEKANSWLDEAESFMRSIAALKDNLEKAKREAAGEIEAAQLDITKAKKYIAEYDEDIAEQYEEDLAEAQQKLETARAELKKEKPDFIKVVKLALEVNLTADNIYLVAEKEHESAELLRRNAATMLREAQRSYSAAKEYIEDHSSDVDTDADSLLRDAHEALLNAEQCTEAESILQSAEVADKKADSALEEAQEDVERERRERARRQAASQVNWGNRTSTPSYTHRSSSSTIKIGGGGGSFGGSFRGGGGGGMGFSSRGGGGGKW